MSSGEGFRVDLHVKVLDDAVAERAKQRGLDALVYAPHFTHLSTIRERASEYSDDDLLVVPGRECFAGHWSERKHVLAVDPSDPIPDFLRFDATMDELARQDAAVLAPHPEFLSPSMNRSDIATYRDVVDAVEVYNPKHLYWHNRRARAIADATDLPAYASSYAHLRRTVGTVWVTFEEPLENGQDLAAALANGGPESIHYEAGLETQVTRRAEFAHLGWENSWQKFRRVVLEGREPTHPRHPNYDGRFDEQSVY